MIPNGALALAGLAPRPCVRRPQGAAPLVGVRPWTGRALGSEGPVGENSDGGGGGGDDGGG